jgi:hypothetical protein
MPQQSPHEHQRQRFTTNRGPSCIHCNKCHNALRSARREAMGRAAVTCCDVLLVRPKAGPGPHAGHHKPMRPQRVRVRKRAHVHERQHVVLPARQHRAWAAARTRTTHTHTHTHTQHRLAAVFHADAQSRRRATLQHHSAQRIPASTTSPHSGCTRAFQHFLVHFLVAVPNGRVQHTCHCAHPGLPAPQGLGYTWPYLACRIGRLVPN